MTSPSAKKLSDQSLEPAKLSTSVLVISFKRALMLEDCLKAIRASGLQEYELIVVDNSSSNATKAVAERYADKVILNPENLGAAAAINQGVARAAGEVIIAVADDMILLPNALAKIHSEFLLHPGVDAVVGTISKTHPNQDFYSQYKNLYMVHTLSRLPRDLDFITWIPAFRKSRMLPYDEKAWPEDTELGQRMFREGRKIVFCPGAEVVHQKKYGFFSLLKNDFLISKGWLGILIANEGWRHVGKGRRGFAHAPWSQVASLALAVLAPLAGLAGWPFVAAILLMFWASLGTKLFAFLLKERGFWFALRAVPFTLLDHWIMVSGVTAGLAGKIAKPKSRRNS